MQNELRFYPGELVLLCSTVAGGKTRFARHLTKDMASRNPAQQIVYLSDEPCRERTPSNVSYHWMRRPGYRSSLLHILHLLSSEPEKTMLVIDDLRTMFCYPDNETEIISFLCKTARKHHAMILLLVKVSFEPKADETADFIRLTKCADQVLLLSNSLHCNGNCGMIRIERHCRG